MSYALSRLMSAATAGYAGFALARPEHLGQAMGAKGGEQDGYVTLAQVFGVRDAAISTFGVLGRSDRTVRTAMWIRVACDLGDGVVLAVRADDDATRTKVLGVTVTWATLNFLALNVDKARARRRRATREVAAAAAGTVEAAARAVRR